MCAFFSRGKESQNVSFDDILAAREKIKGILPLTPLTHSPGISEIMGNGHEVYFKWDNKLKTGSFKERGAATVLALLSEAEKKRGVCAASAGNHALALSYHAARLKIPCHIVMPMGASLIKVESTQRTGAHVMLQGNTFDEAYEYAVNLSKKESYVFISAFDDVRVIVGQGTSGLEIMDQLSDFDSVIVPIGGGGLISGIATAIKEKKPSAFILGVQSEWAVEARKDRGNKAPFIPATIADGIAVKRVGQITAPIIESKVDKVVSISENQIAKAIIKFLEVERTVIEGAGAAALGALLEKHLPQQYKKNRGSRMRE